MNIKFKNEAYDFLKKVAQLYLPALGTLYFALAAIWHLPNTAQVIGSITALDTFLGVILGLSSASYAAVTPTTDGDLHVSETADGRTTLQFAFNGDPAQLVSKDTLVFNVKK